MIKWKVDDGSVNKDEDYCVTDTQLYEFYCDQSKKQVSATECNGICSCGKCFGEGEEINCEADYRAYCTDESCDIVEKNISEIHFISKTELNEGCLVEEECRLFVGKYAFNDYPIQTYIEPNANVNFGELGVIIEKKFGEYEIGDFASGEYYIVENGSNILFMWVSKDKLVTLEVPSPMAEKEEEENLEEFLTVYLETHPSDVEKNLNFFERVIDWFKNLFG